MGELVPSVLLHGQALEILEEMQEAHEDGFTKDTFEVINIIQAVLTRFHENAGKPLLDYESVAETEPPLSDKSNRFWRTAERDINLLQQQIDVLRAAMVFTHNGLTTSIKEADNQNARLDGKMKSLQMYSRSREPNIITFGDSFGSYEFIDLDRVPSAERPSLPNKGYVTLGQVGDLVNLSQEADITILSTSNGFLGNNQELDDPSGAPSDPETGMPLYTFKGELRDYGDLEAITDEEPNTWIEYESFELGTGARLTANNFNFEYIRTLDDGSTELVDWAERPEDGILRLGLEFDLGRIRNLNTVEFTPYGLEDNINHPVLVRQIQTSPNGTDWTRVFPANLWVGTDVNLETAQAADNVVAHKALWAFEARAVRYVRIYIEQHHGHNTNVGHIYWVDRRTDERIEGPNPPEEDPGYFYTRTIIGNARQQRENFNGRRWAIGIRDIILQQVEYANRSVLVTRPLRVDGIIDRVMLEEANFQVPPEYPEGDAWVKFFVSPDDGENWFEISPIQDTFRGVPEQIAFNDPLPDSLRERNVANHNVDRPVSSIRLKVELTRPSDMRSTTPVLNSYTLKVMRR